MPVSPGSCQAAALAWPDIASLTALWSFEQGSAARALIHGLKYAGQPATGLIVGRRMARLVTAPFDVIVPVPLSRLRLRERGFNQAELLAEGFAAAGGDRDVVCALARARSTPSLAGLNRRDRAQSSGDLFRCGHPDAVSGRRVLLVDDVFTTGSTASAAARALVASGAVAVHVVTACLTPRRLEG